MQTVRKLVSMKELKTVLGIAFSFEHIAHLEAAGKSPQRIKLGQCRVAWIMDEVLEWIEERITQRDLKSHANASF